MNPPRPDELPNRRVRPDWWYRQSAAAPVRPGAAGVQVLLVTSAGGRRWVLPKGIVEPGLTPRDSAAKEAWEEAGVRGRPESDAVGVYEYEKWGGTCEVEVFVLDVEDLEAVWPEWRVRMRLWAGLEQAARLVREPALAQILRGLARRKAAPAGGEAAPGRSEGESA